MTLYCEYVNASAKEIDDDVVVVTGFAGSAGLGAIVGLFIYSAMVTQALSLQS